MIQKNGYLVIEGPIGVGKSTLARALAPRLEAQLILEDAQSNPFIQHFYESPAHHALPTQLQFLLQRIEKLNQLNQGSLFNPLHISDFMLQKDALFAELTLSHDELALYHQIHQHLCRTTPVPDLVIYLQASTETLIQRIHRRGLEYEQRIDLDYLQRVAEAYTYFFHEHADSPLLIVNTEHLNFADRPEDCDLLLERIHAIDHGHHYFNPTAL